MKSLHLTILICIVLPLGACSPKHGRGGGESNAPAPVGAPPTKLDGGQDGGGGNATPSTPDEVRAAIHEALVMATEDGRMNIYKRFADQVGFDLVNLADLKSRPVLGTDPYVQTLAKLEKQHLLILNSDPKTPFSERSQIPALKTLPKNKIQYLDSGDCVEPQHKNADASVTSFTLDATICFSVGNLTRIPSHALLSTILPLLLHEIAHLSGAEEDEAQNWQDLFDNYYGKWLIKLQEDDLGNSIFISLKRVQEGLKYASDLNKSAPDDPGIYVRLGAALSDLSAIPYLLDPLAMKVALSPKHPEFVANYGNSAVALYQDIFDTIYGPNFPMKYPAEVVPLVKLGAANLTHHLSSWVSQANVITGNFTAYLYGGKSTCLLPKYSQDSVLPLPERQVQYPLFYLPYYYSYRCDIPLGPQ